MEERAPQNGWFFIRFVVFTSNLVYSVVYNHSVYVPCEVVIVEHLYVKWYLRRVNLLSKAVMSQLFLIW